MKDSVQTDAPGSDNDGSRPLPEARPREEADLRGKSSPKQKGGGLA